MGRRSFVAAVLLLCSSALCRAADSGATSNMFDGQWSVDLVCADTQDRSGLVKGYEYRFTVTISDGKLQGEYGAKGAPASIVYSGNVAGDGTLEIKAVGNTGRSDYSVGKVARGSNYSYTMAGKLEHERGRAARREIRPCTAAFTKL